MHPCVVHRLQACTDAAADLYGVEHRCHGLRSRLEAAGHPRLDHERHPTVGRAAGEDPDEARVVTQRPKPRGLLVEPHPRGVVDGPQQGHGNGSAEGGLSARPDLGEPPVAEDAGVEGPLHRTTHLLALVHRGGGADGGR